MCRHPVVVKGIASAGVLRSDSSKVALRLRRTLSGWLGSHWSKQSSFPSSTHVEVDCSREWANGQVELIVVFL